MHKNDTMSRAALIQRINRRLRAEGQALRSSRGQRQLTDLGDFYVFDHGRNTVVASHISYASLDAWARREVPGVLRADEEGAP